MTFPWLKIAADDFVTALGTCSSSPLIAVGSCRFPPNSPPQAFAAYAQLYKERPN
jgi:hypothetical protein